MGPRRKNYQNIRRSEQNRTVLAQSEDDLIVEMCIRGVPIVVCVGHVLLLLACLACLLGFIAPFWVNYPQHLSLNNPIYDRDEWAEGLWAVCVRHNWKCFWFWEQNFAIERNFPVWHKVSQGLFAGGILLMLTMFVILSTHVCCKACRASVSIAPLIASGTIVSILLITGSLTVYGVYSANENGTKVNAMNQAPNFTWAYFLTVAGLGVALISSGLLYGQLYSDRKHAGYSPASQVV
jgi:hypothetical protein